jgi:hypothetical protein
MWFDLPVEQPVIQDGLMQLPTAPGFGLCFKPDVIECWCAPESRASDTLRADARFSLCPISQYFSAQNDKPQASSCSYANQGGKKEAMPAWFKANLHSLGGRDEIRT